jgi:hypothetical protein
MQITRLVKYESLREKGEWETPTPMSILKLGFKKEHTPNVVKNIKDFFKDINTFSTHE